MEKARAEAYLRSEQRKQRQQMARVEVTSGGEIWRNLLPFYSQGEEQLPIANDCDWTVPISAEKSIRFHG